MGARGYNAGGFAWMDWVTCPLCGAKRPLDREMRQKPEMHKCPSKKDCAKRQSHGKYLHRINGVNDVK